MTSRTPYQSVSAYFSGVEADRSVRSLQAYFAPDLHYTGSAFDPLIATSSPNRFTPVDMLAVSTLSVDVPARAALRLIDSPDAEALLADIPTTETIWSGQELLDDGGNADLLWKLVGSHPDVGRTKTSKLLAAKRPHLIPIYDKHVAAALGFGDNQWQYMQDVARDPNAPTLTAAIENARTAAGISADVSDLRIIDVVIWQRQHGWRSHETDKCACDFAGFERPVGQSS